MTHYLTTVAICLFASCATAQSSTPTPMGQPVPTNLPSGQARFEAMRATGWFKIMPDEPSGRCEFQQTGEVVHSIVCNPILTVAELQRLRDLVDAQTAGANEADFSASKAEIATLKAFAQSNCTAPANPNANVAAICALIRLERIKWKQ